MNLGVYTYRLQALLNEAKNILIFLTKESDLDSTASSLGLYLSLSQTGKQVVIVSPDKMTVEKSDLFAVDKITDNLGQEGENLVVSFPYVEGSIEKVSYNIENNRFNLVIEPRGEGSLLTQDNIEFTRAGEGADNFDLIFTIGVTDYSDLGKFQSSHKKLLEEKPAVVINNRMTNVPFGTLRIINSSNSSTSEMVALLLSKLNLPIDHDIAENLLAGIKEKTANFSKNFTADSFEAAAICMRKTVDSRMPKQPIDQKKTPPDWLKPKIFHSSNSTKIIGNNKGTLI